MTYSQFLKLPIGTIVFRTNSKVPWVKIPCPTDTCSGDVQKIGEDYTVHIWDEGWAGEFQL